MPKIQTLQNPVSEIRKADGGAPPNPLALLSGMGGGRSSAHYKSKQTIFCQGDPADAVYYIESGRVQLTVVSDQGKEGVVAILGDGDFFGEACLAGQVLYTSSAIASTECELIRIEKPAMLRLLHEQSGFSEMFMGFLLSRNIQIEEDLVDQLFNSSEKRLARVLLILANFGKDGGMTGSIPKVSQEVLAARVGTTRSRINYFMNKFRKLGLIEYGEELRVHPELLNVIVNE